MKIHLLSDTHIEFGLFAHKAPYGADVIVLAGDIGEGLAGLEWARKTFNDNQPIVYIAGNHEFYFKDLDLLTHLRKKAQELGIYFLENNSFEWNEVRFLGCTLWSDFNKWNRDDVDLALSSMNDYKCISVANWLNRPENTKKAHFLFGKHYKSLQQPFLNPLVTYLLHKESVEWLDRQLSDGYQGKTIVVTHHAPSLIAIKGIRNEKKNQLIGSYASDMSNLLNKHQANIECWLHGHTHRPMDYYTSGVHIITNARGYPSYEASVSSHEMGHYETEFNAKMIIDI